MRKLAPIALLLLCTIKTVAQVSLQTGSAVFSLPIFNWQDDKSRLTSVVALSYNSGNGVKANGVPDYVGEGWNLVAGGIISRMQVGEPDDQLSNGSDNGNDQDITKYPPGYMYATVPVSQGCPLALTKYPIYKALNQIYAQHNSTNSDRQLDYFTYQFNGKTGLFVLDVVHGIGQPLGDSKMKISFQTGTIPNARTTITSFTVQDVDGLSYKFSVLGQAEVLRTKYCSSNLIPRSQPKFKSGNTYYQANYEDPSTIVNPWVVGNWYLSEIDDPLTGRKVVFKYNPRTIFNNAGADIVYYSNSNYTMTSFKTSKVQAQNLDSIIYPDGHKVAFNNGSARVDLNGDTTLGSIDVLYTDTLSTRYISKYVLTTSYFIWNRYGNPITATEKSAARLCLRSVTKIGVDLKEDTPPYQFDYYLSTGSNNTDDIIPPPFFYAKDIWGYYNGNNSQGGVSGNPIRLNVGVNQLNFDECKGLCYLRGSTPTLLVAKSNYAQNGLLKQVIYPTGGTLKYQYAQNTGAFDVSGQSTIQTVGGVHVSQTSSTDGGYSNGCGNPIITTYNYMQSGTSTPSLWGMETPVNSVTINTHYLQDGKTRHWWSFYKCNWNYTYPGLLAMDEAVNLKWLQQVMIAISPALDIVSAIGDVVDIVNLCLGATPLAIIAVVVDFISAVITFFTTCTPNTQDGSQTIYNSYNLNDAAPLPTQFSRVEVVESPTGIGKTVYDFTNAGDYPLWVTSNPDYTTRQRFASWAYGLPKLTTVIDANGDTVRQTKNVYNFGSNNYSYLMQTSLNLSSCKCTVGADSSQRADQWTDPTRYNNTANYVQASIPGLAVDNYTMYTGRTVVDTTYEKVYKQHSTLNDLTTIGYYYNTSNYEVSQSFTIQSNGDVVRKYFNYSNNYSTGVYATLASTNNIAIPIETITNVYRNGGAAGTITQKVTEYQQQTNGDIKPSRLLENRFSQLGGTSYYNPANGTSGFIVAQQFTYDGSGNLVGLQDEGNRLVTNIYGYKDKYIIASVINADPVLDKSAYSSFEVKDNNFGGWTLNGSGTYNTVTAITGSQSYILSAGSTFSASLNTAKSYLVSFWAASTGISVSGGTLVKSAPTYNGFTYYEYSIAQGTATVSVSGTVAIDELRLYPSNARMRSTTYDPLIGKTSECDENNRITYYEYDNLGRLKFVKDETKNALKMYEYNNISAGKQNGCPATYSNNAIAEQFIKSNCSGGTLPDSTTFSIPAGVFTSTLSQADADAQAEDSLIKSGQSYADANGHCRVIYYNATQSVTDTTQNCAEGLTGGLVTYTVPAGTYSSIISQADADQQASDDILANAQAWANNPAHAVCSVTTTADWTWTDGSQIKCQQVSGATHEFILATDLNPNSSTYNQTEWVDIGTPQDACPVTTCSFQWQGGITNTVTSNISSSAGTTSFQLVFGAPTNNYSGGTIGQITGGCAPSANRTVLVTDGGNSSRQWNVTFNTSGSVSISLYSGPQASMGTNPPIVLSGSFSQ